MKNENWQLIQELFNQAVDLPQAELDKFFENRPSCSKTVIDEVRQLIEADRRKTRKTRYVLEDLTSISHDINTPRINGYDIMELIAHGGMGSVYRAYDNRLSRSVAIKVLHPYLSDQQKFKDRFMREARAAARIQHENINTIYDIAESDNGVIHIASAYCEGQNLSQKIRQRDLTLQQILSIMQQLVSALVAAHKQGIIHRDLKPENIIVDSFYQLKLVDFGIAKIRDEHHTSTGEIIGTPAYMSPEQFRGDAIDPSTDIWASGMILYEMLEGKTPYDGKTAPEIIYSMLHEPIAYSPTLREKYKPLYDIIQHCLNIDKSLRPANAEHIRQHLLKALAQLKSSEHYKFVPEYSEVKIPQKADAHPSIASHKSLFVLQLFGQENIIQDNEIELALALVKKYRGQLLEKKQGQQIPHNCRVATFGFPLADELTIKNGLLCGLAWVEACSSKDRCCKALADYQYMQTSTATTQHTAPLTQPIDSSAVQFVNGQADANLWITDSLVNKLPEALVKLSSSFKQQNCHAIVKRSGASKHPFTVTLSPFTGREAQLAILKDNWQQALEGEYQRVLISGEAGIGKSRLIYEFSQTVENEAVKRIELACSPYEQSTTYFPLLGYLKQNIQTFKKQVDEVLDMATLESFLDTLFETETLDALLLGQLLGLSLTEKQATLLPTGDLLNRKYQSLLLRILTANRDGITTLIIVEDLHWIDQATSLIIEQLLQPAQTRSTFIILSCRPEYKPGWLTNVVTSNLYLNKLRTAQSESLLTQLLEKSTEGSDKAFKPGHLSTLAERTGGNPLFIEELAKSLRRQSGEQDQVPESIQDTLISRLDKLGAAHELAQVASVIGRNFKRSLLQRCSNDDNEFDNQFNTLVQAEIFYPSNDSDQWYFKHALIRDAAYQTLHQDSKQHLHAVIAKTIEQTDEQLVHTQPALIALHWEKSGDTAKAIQYWQQSAQRNLTLFAISESIDQCEHALELSEQIASKNDKTRLQLAIYTTLGPALMNRYGYADERAGKAYGKALALSKQLNDTSEIINILFGNWTYHCVRAEHLTAYPMSQEMIRLSESRNVRSEICESYMVQGINDFYRGEFIDARQTLQTAIDFYEREDSTHHIVTYGQNPFVATRNFQAWNELMLGEIDKAIAYAIGSVAHARETNHPMTLAYALSYATYVFMSIGDFEEAEKRVNESIKVCTDNEVILFLGLSLILQALLFFNKQQIEAGEKAMAKASEVYLPTGAQVMIPNFLAVQAEVLMKAGRLQEAEALIDQSLAILEQTKENWCLAPVQAMKTTILTLMKKPEDAQEWMQKLIQTLNYQQAEGIRLMLKQKSMQLPE